MYLIAVNCSARIILRAMPIILKKIKMSWM